MKRLIMILTAFSYGLVAFAQHTDSYFNAGIHYGLSLSTIQKYNNEFGFFDEWGYGKKIGGNLGFFVNRQITEKVLFETGMYYSLKGTKYRISRGNNNGSTTKTYWSNIHYIQFPVILGNKMDNTPNITIRYGATLGYQFSNFISGIPVDADIVNKFDLEALIGLRIKPKGLKFFDRNYLVIEYCCSVLPIIKPNKTSMLSYKEEFLIEPNQRNMSLTFSVQHFLNFDR